ncbi:MAG TPA: hypothetical protein VIM51_10740 [Desulfosporosinus sp.]
MADGTCQLCDELWKGEPVRQLGVRVSELCQNNFRQLALFEKDYEKESCGSNDRFASRPIWLGCVFRSSFLNSGLRFRSGGTVDDEEYPMMSSIL